MAVDMSCAGLMHRENYLIGDDALLVLEAGLVSDRVRRVRYDRIASIVVSSQLAWGPQLLASISVALGIALALSGNETAIAFGVLILVIGGLLFARYALCRRYVIRLARAGEQRVILCTLRPGKVRSFIDRLGAAIDSAQQAAAARAASLSPATVVEETDVPQAPAAQEIDAQPTPQG